MADLIRNARKGGLFVGFSTKIAVLVGGCAAAVAGLAFLSLTFSFGDVASAWVSYRSCLSSSYLFIAVNLIVFAIWTLSQTKHDHHNDEPPAPLAVAAAAAAAVSENPGDLGGESSPPPKTSPDTWHDQLADPAPRSGEEYGSSEVSCLTVDSEDKSPVSSRLQISVPMEDADAEDTLEARWRVIMEGGASPVKRNLRKSDTWERSSRPEMAPRSPLSRAAPPPATLPEPAVHRGLTASETFRGAAVRGGGFRGREFLGRTTQDDMDRKFDDFIRQNKLQMRLQRQEIRA